MAESLSREVMEDLMFGSGKVRRFTQDSPILPDVWLQYAEDPEKAVDLLITPYRNDSPAEVARVLRERIKAERKSAKWKKRHPEAVGACVVHNQATVAARLYFDELIRVILPMSEWWHDTVAPKKWHERLGKEEGRNTLARTMRDPQHPPPPKKKGAIAGERISAELVWLARIIGALEMKRQGKDLPRGIPVPGERKDEWREVADAVAELTTGVETPSKETRIYGVSVNREASLAVARSVLAVKGDAARRLFDIDCSRLTWGILDSGIDARHPAFRLPPPKEADEEALKERRKKDPSALSRIRETFDFTEIRELLDPDAEELPPNIVKRMRQRRIPAKTIQTERFELQDRIRKSLDIDWSELGEFLKIRHDRHYEPPKNDHGTHVAGILAADWTKDNDENFPEKEPIRGICPDLRLYDVRVFAEDGTSNEFAIMAALQFLRHLNRTSEYLAVHGVNLSFSIEHDVANYACGRTPVCEEAERVVSAGVVVVAAAGNKGFVKEGASSGYHTVSVTDPGNAETVITVGATHRYKPHTYGVSYFSSRGPTGDGRCKPDLVAPGEKITATAPDAGTVRKDGTSQAAPHVSGAAALLMARHHELVGNPARVKHILCSTATDLGRERYFQGAGMLDALRALQSV